MSHQPERKAKNCLNCGTDVVGRFCHQCGQENIVPHQNFLSLTKHFVYDIFHFDGKFFDTLGHLLFRPGIITKEYVAGKRQKYLDPIRMYLFTSAVFFLVFFTLQGTIPLTDKGPTRLLGKAERMDLLISMQHQLARRSNDSLFQQQLRKVLDTNLLVILDSSRSRVARPDSLVSFQGRPYVLHFMKNPDIETKAGGKNSWFGRKVKARVDAFQAKHDDKPGEATKALLENFLHKLPYVLFVSLPFFAGILKLLYIRRKKFFYSDHAVFTLHHYILTFIILLFVVISDELEDVSGWRFFGYFNLALLFTWMGYLYLEMKRFYGQGWLKTLGKFMVLCFLAVILMLILTSIFFLLSIFQI